MAQVTQTEDGDSTTTPVVVYLHDDVLGSTQSVTNADGTQNTPRSFGLFGTAEDALTASDVPYGFTGQEEDVELGLINMHGRMYDPTLGQFMSPDPVIQSANSQGLNRFAYVMNSPLNYVDPSGFTSEGTTLGIDIGVGAAFAGGLAATLLGNGGYGAPMEVGESVGGGAPLSAGALAGGDIETAAGSGITSAGAANALAGAGAIAHAALQDIALSGMNAVHTTKTVTPTANTNVSSLGGSPPINRTAYGQMGTSPTTEAGQSALRGAEPLEPVPGTVHPGEPIADPGVRRELQRAWKESHPSGLCDLNARTCSAPTREQGGWIIERSNPAHGQSRYYVLRWPDTNADFQHIPVPERPEGLNVVGSFHTHPNTGSDARPSASNLDWPAFSHGDIPHYIISEDTVYRITDIQEDIGPLFPSSHTGLFVGIGIGVGTVAGIGTYEALHNR